MKNCEWKRALKCKSSAAALLLAATLLGACSSEPSSDGGGMDQADSASSASESGTGQSGSGQAPATGEALTGEAAVAAMKALTSAQLAKPEHDAANVEVQHLLVGHSAARGLRGVTRSKGEAEILAAELLQRALAGEDFGALVKEHTDDAYPGIYPMSASGRNQMVKGFGDISWHLGVGEYGVALEHPTESPYGWHIVKRLK